MRRVFLDLGLTSIHNSSLSDEEVVSRVLAGDRALYEILMRRYNQRLFRITRSMLGDDAEAEDVVQDAYVRAYAALDQFAGRAKFGTWLTKIAIYEASGRSRKRRIDGIRLSPAEHGPTMETVKSSDPNPEENALRNETISLLEQSIDALPDLYRSVFVLRNVEQMSTTETASCLDLTEEAVKVRLMRARQLLRRELYARAGATSSQAFQFLGSRCDRIVHRVFDRLAIERPQ
jgi:RNA polymerase sigma-70 factor (ECF subfamily)